MTKPLFIFLLILVFPISSCWSQNQVYQGGEWFKYRVHYGWFNASFATLQVDDVMIGDTPVYHIKGHGESTGLLDLFFKVNDTYESFVDQKTGLPYKFVRKINEGGYKKHKIIYFDHRNNSVKVRDLLHNRVDSYFTEPGVQDMISAVYYLRNHIDQELTAPGDSLVMDMFFDDKNYKFKTIYLGEEIIKTKFGKVKCIKLRPYVQSGRVFKEKESLTVWVTADKNKIPIKIKANLAVGSLTADLIAYRNLKYPFRIIMK